MPFQRLQFRAGINRETTDYANDGGWYDGDRVRFRLGVPEKIGGWLMFNNTTFSGSCRFLMRHRINSGAVYTLVCTHTHVYLEDGGTLNDITPWEEEDTALSNPFTTTAASSAVAVVKTTHGRAVGDRIDISGATGFDGISTANLNGERIVVTITDTNNYKFTAGENAGSGATGGGTVAIKYILQDGIDAQVFGLGWGADPFGGPDTLPDRHWGDPGTNPVASDATIRLWSADAFGEDIVMTPSNSTKEIFLWDATNGVGVRAIPLSTVVGATDTLQNCSIVKVSDKDRHVIGFGVDAFEAQGTLEPLLIRWANQESAINWTASSVTTSGQLFVTGGNEIIAVIKARQQFLVWTDDNLHGLSYIGGTYTYGITTLARGTSIIGRNAAVSYLGVAYWMGDRGFYRYDGQVTEIPCTVEDYVFTDLCRAQSSKVMAAVNSLYNEIVWHYPSTSGGTDENDLYVSYNITDETWCIGTMVRTARVDNFLSNYPIAADKSGNLFFHEIGYSDGSVNPPVSLNAFIESSPLEIGDGYEMMHLDWVLPDVTFRDSTATAPSVKMTLKMRDAPGVGVHDSANDSVLQSASAPVELFTRELDMRLRGRSVSVRWEDNVDTENSETAWRVGITRIRVRPDGRR